jgi:hypothetical protein
MARLQLQEAIEGPLEQISASMQPALVQRLLNQLSGDPDRLPLLEHLLSRLWENWQGRGGSGPIGLEDYISARSEVCRDSGGAWIHRTSSQ